MLFISTHLKTARRTNTEVEEPLEQVNEVWLFHLYKNLNREQLIVYREKSASNGAIPSRMLRRWKSKKVIEKMNQMLIILLKKRVRRAPIALNGKIKGKEKTPIKNDLKKMVAETRGSEVGIAPRKNGLGKRISDIIRRKRPMHQVRIKVEKRRKNTLEIGHKKRLPLSIREEIERAGAPELKINNKINEGKVVVQ